MIRGGVYLARMMVLQFGVLLMLAGCLTTNRSEADRIQSSDFELVLAADMDEVDSGRPGVRHRLVNRSRTDVCIGGTQILKLNGQTVRADVLHDGLCQTPLIAAPVDGFAEWVVEWRNPGCVPTEELGNLPDHLACTDPEGLFESEIVIYPMQSGQPQRPAVEVTGSLEVGAS